MALTLRYCFVQIGANEYILKYPINISNTLIIWYIQWWQWEGGDDVRDKVNTLIISSFQVLSLTDRSTDARTKLRSYESELWLKCKKKKNLQALWMAYSAPLGDVDELLWLLTATTLMFRKGPQGRPSPRGLSRATSRETQNDFRTLLNHTSKSLHLILLKRAARQDMNGMSSKKQI